MSTDQESAALDATRVPSTEKPSGALPLGPLGAVKDEDGRFARVQVWSKSLFIFLFIAIGTVWLPSYLMKPNSLAIPRDLYQGLMSASTWSLVLSLIVSGVWTVALVASIYGLRLAQKRKLI
ncbi:MAG: hypothetical protein ABFR89_11945 [Actinomycetota bacterium]